MRTIASAGRDKRRAGAESVSLAFSQLQRQDLHLQHQQQPAQPPTMSNRKKPSDDEEEEEEFEEEVGENSDENIDDEEDEEEESHSGVDGQYKLSVVQSYT